MNTNTTKVAVAMHGSTDANTSKIDFKQYIKWAVYLLLTVNFSLYINEEWTVAQHVLRDGGSFLDWTASFKTSIDVTAWLILLFLFELETYALSDEQLTKRRVMLMHFIRLICYSFVAHTVYVNITTAHELLEDIPLAINSLCELVDTNVSYTRNYAYTLIDQSNCQSLSTETQFYSMDAGAAVTDQTGWAFIQYMSKLDVIESISWISVMIAIDVVVRIQERGITSGPLLRGLNSAKLVFYSVLWVAIGHWLYYGLYLYAWDEFLWIAGFAAIEMNVAEWRQEIVEEHEQQSS